MKLYSVSTAAALLSAAPLIAAQTYTTCNPLQACEYNFISTVFGGERRGKYRY
jgi:hypothetical protein